jgi:hypothetical protein
MIYQAGSYTCAHCGFNVHPCAGTIFQDTRTPLRMWFYAIYLFVMTRHGVSGKELQRQLGVTYKTAYRIGIQIRKLMQQADVVGLLGGHVEMDEAYVGGRRSGGKRGRGAEGKAIVMGMKERWRQDRRPRDPRHSGENASRGRARKRRAGLGCLDR